MSSTSLTVWSRALMVIDEEPLDLLSHTMEAKAAKLNAEAADIKHQIEAIEAQVGKALHSYAYEFPDLAERLRIQMNRMAALTGMPPVPADVDPLSNKREDGVNDPAIEAAMAKKQQEEALSIEEALKTPQGKALLAECKKVFQWIAPRVHPDKSKDRSLHHVFDLARSALKDNNLTMLRGMQNEIKQYLRIKKKNKTFQAYIAQLVEANQREVDKLLTHKAQIRQTVQWQCLEAFTSGNAFLRMAAYGTYVELTEQKIKQHVDRMEAEALGRARRQQATSNQYHTSN